MKPNDFATLENKLYPRTRLDMHIGFAFESLELKSHDGFLSYCLTESFYVNDVVIFINLKLRIKNNSQYETNIEQIWYFQPNIII